MRLRCPGMLVLIGMLSATGPASAQTAPEWATRQTAQWYNAFNAGDTAAITKLYAADAVLLLHGQTFTGRQAIEAFHRGNFAKGRFACKWNIRSVTAVDKLAAVSGDDACVGTPKSRGAPVRFAGRWLMVYQLQPDGSRLIVRDAAEDAAKTPQAKP